MTASTVLVVATLAVTGYPSRIIVSKTPHAQAGAPAAASSVHAAASVPVPVEMPAAAPAGSAASIEPTIITAKPQKVSVEEPKQTRLATNHVIWPPAGLATPPAPPAAALEAGEPAPKAAKAEPGTSGSPESTPTSDNVNQTPVTITGCLETTVDEGRFRLTDAEGADVPKTRGWRSGFLKKRSAPVELVQPSDVAALKKLVGRRVAATGLLTNRDLHLQSFRSAGNSCD